MPENIDDVYDENPQIRNYIEGQDFNIKYKKRGRTKYEISIETSFHKNLKKFEIVEIEKTE